MATLGQKLTTPESSWKRYDDTYESMFILTGTWSISRGNSNAYNSSLKYTVQANAKIKFAFYGTKVRFIGYTGTSNTASVSVYIDGVLADTFSTTISSVGYQALVYEKTGLSLSNHTIEFINNQATEFDFDAVDIDDIGYLIHPILGTKSKTTLTDLQIGDFINCEYTATTSGTVGTFNNLGSATKMEIPLTSTATPDGTFNFICVDKKAGVGGIAIADRVIQHSISWDTLNANKMIENCIMLKDSKGNLFPMVYSSNAMTSIIPILTSNTSASSTVGTVIFDSEYTGWYTYGWMAFDGKFVNTNNDYATPWMPNGSARTGWLGFNFNTPKTVKCYSLAPQSYSAGVSRMCTSWTFEGSNDGTNWTKLHTVANYTSWAVDKISYFTINNNTPYKMYRINITNNNGDTYLAVGDFRMSEDVFTPNVLIRSLSGGVAHADANGNLSTTNLSLGGFPTINEWDKYIVNSDLNGKISKGDNAIWNWNGIYVWCMNSSSTLLADNTNRIVRGNATCIKLSSIISNTANTAVGFRPVLIWREDDGNLI